MVASTGVKTMQKSISMHALTSVRTSRRRAVPLRSRVAQEALTLLIGCVAAACIALGLCLIAPAETRDAIVTAFLGFDQPIGSIPSHPPLPL